MKRMPFILTGLFFLVWLAATLGGCVDDRYTEKAPTGDEVQLLVELNVPGVSTAAVRSLDVAKEQHIDELDVLVFKVDGTTEKFAYKTEGVLASGTTYKVNFKKSEADETYRFVFLANLHTKVNTESATFTTSTSKEAALAAITFEAEDPWDTTTPRYLPLWGESTNTHKVDAVLSTSDIGTVYMLRSVARVDILLNPTTTSTSITAPDATGFSDFLLKSVKVCNASKKGAAAPSTGNWTHATGTDIPVATKPTVVGTTTNDICDITYFAAIPVVKHKFIREIYIAESANTTDGGTTNKSSESDMTYLLISGSYNGGGETWYRLDFVHNQTNSLRWDILRNHCYTFNIKGINGPGYASEQDARDAHPMNLEYDITVSSESGITDLVFNGQYMLGVSKRSYKLNLHEYSELTADYFNSTDNQLTITTDYPKGWTISTSKSWLSVTESSSTAAKKTISLTLALNDTGGPRTGEIKITAGNLSIDVIVEQKHEDANCYIVTTNGRVLIPVFRANKSMLGPDQLAKSTVISSELVWTDTPHSAVAGSIKGTGNDGAIKKIEKIGTGSLGYIGVETGSKPGNAVVAVKSGNNILWSWHIWVTDYTPAPSAIGGFMDRNLGAIGNVPGNPKTKGLLYQWGRKDPFPSSKTKDGIEEPDLYTDDAITSAKAESYTSADNFLASVQHPLTHYYGGSLIWIGTLNTTLWGSSKTVYDPCPLGWRVPTSGTDTASPWNALDIYAFPWDGTNIGRTNAAHGGFYPAAGFRGNEGGLYMNTISNAFMTGNYWSASASSYISYCLYFHFDEIRVSGNYFHSYGLSVRCVQDVSR